MAANRTAVLAVLVSAALLLVGATAPGAAHPGNTGPGGDTSATARTDAAISSGVQERPRTPSTRAFPTRDRPPAPTAGPPHAR